MGEFNSSIQGLGIQLQELKVFALAFSPATASCAAPKLISLVILEAA